MKLNAKNFALAGGIVWGISVFVLTWIAVFTGYASGFLEALGALYIGFTISGVGSLIGFIWGFLDAFIGLYIFAVVYNHFQKGS